MTLSTMAAKGSPEQGVSDFTGRYGPCQGDTGCGFRGTGQRGLGAVFNGAGHKPGQSGHGCGQE